MSHDTSRFINLLEKRLRAFEALASEIAAGQLSCVSLDLGALTASDWQKERLCAEIRSLDLEVSELAGSAPGRNLLQSFAGREAGDPGASASEAFRRVRQLCEQSEAARAEAGRRNLIYTEFLRRARGTVNVMMNVVSHCMGVYTEPTLEGCARSPFDRG